MLVLECNGFCYKYYDHKKEEEQEEFITKHYGLIRFHNKANWEDLINAVLKR